MIGRKIIKNGLRLWLVMVVFVLAVKVAGGLAPARPQTYVLEWQEGSTYAIVASDVYRNIATNLTLPSLETPYYNDTWTLSPNGHYLAFRNTFDLIRMDLYSGDIIQLTQDGRNNQTPVWSPDGKHGAFVAGQDSEAEICVIEADGSHRQQLTVNQTDDMSPVWSPDGRHILFISQLQTGVASINVMDADGSHLQQLTVEFDSTRNSPPAWSPDGQHIAFVSFRDANKYGDRDADIYVMEADGSHQQPLTANETDDWDPSWSPDGRQIVFTSDGGSTVYVMDSDGRNAYKIATIDGGFASPTWSPDGQFITFYTLPNGYGLTYIVNADGSDLHWLSTWDPPVISPLWFVSES